MKDATRLTAGCRNEAKPSGAVAVSKLHFFDLQLSNDVHFNVHRHLADKKFAQYIGRLDARLVEYFRTAYKTDKRAPTDLPFVLNENELRDVEDAVADFSAKWVPAPRRYRFWVTCASEIERHLGAAAASEWGAESVGFVQQLEGIPLGLDEGIALVREWLRLLRSYMANIGEGHLLPAPAGGSATPTNPQPPVVPAEERSGKRSRATPEDDVKRMREAIRQHEKGSKATPGALIKKAKIGNQRGRRALHVLEKRGEYHGFLPSKAKRVRDESTGPKTPSSSGPLADDPTSPPAPGT